MKLLSHVLAGMILILGSLQAEEKIDFHLSTATARKVNAYPPETFISEFGDATGPFKRIGGVVVNASGVDYFSTSVDRNFSDLHPGIKDPNTVLHVEFFVNEMGNGFGVVHKRPVKKHAPVEEAEPKDDRPYDHVALCQAAQFAIARGNTKLLESLLQAGLSIDVPLDLEAQWTALHYSAVQNQPRAAKALVENGATLDQRCKYGKRPIDYAFEDGQLELCEVLRNPDKNDRNVGAYPEALLDELFRRPADKNDEVRFLSLNGNDPSDELLKYFRRFWPNVRTRSQAEEVDRNAQPEGQAKTSYRDVKTKDYGIVVEVNLKRTSDDTFDWSHREATGPSLAGGGTSGKSSWKYGYWLKHDTSSWDE
jgi:hypothetical protein